MKFLCDRCKTRYSIGDDRVRGKILKIRCKNCANVITVREGMPDADAVAPAADPAAPASPRRPQKTTTAAPAIQSESPLTGSGLLRIGQGIAAASIASGPSAGVGARAAAAAPASAKPPPALEEEWYVSIDGDQAGPFSLPEAQRWVAARPHDAELYCWNEGFDDWLPIDKVSHFRGLRKRPAPATAPPPLPRSATGAMRAVAPPRHEVVREEETPKPLFAATMAQLEKGSQASDLRKLPGAPGTAAPGTAAPMTTAIGVPPAAGASPAPGVSAPLSNGLGGPRAAKAPLKAFDPSELDAATQLQAAPFDVSSGDGSAPVPAPRLGALGRAAPSPLPAPLPAPLPSPLPSLSSQPLPMLAPMPPPPAEALPPGPAAGLGDDDDLDIGEVSRVVKLADLAKAAARTGGGLTPAPTPAPRAATRGEGLRPGDVPAGPFAGGAGDAAALRPAPDASPPPAPVSHRRALIALIAGAVVLIAGAVAVVFFVVDRGDGETSVRATLGTVEEVDTTRPDVIRKSTGTGSDSGSAEVAITEPETPNPLVPRPPKRPPTGSGTPPVLPEVPLTGTKLEAREIEEMASKNSATTQRCYMRAQRGAEGIIVGDVKKIAVTLTIGGDGSVTDTQLSDNHAQNALGRCLIGSIRLWKFRTSPGGTFRFVLLFG